MTSIKKNDILNCIDYCKKNRLFDRLNSIYATLPSGNCTGCGNCCMESVGINLIEFINIFEHLKSNDKLRKKCLSKVLDYYFLEFVQKSACPFKDENNRCLIYEVRPLNCRLFGHWKKDDYNKNLENVTQRNIEYNKVIKSKYGFDINDEVVNYKIKYCEDFVPQNGHMDKSTRLSFADELMILDSNIYSKGIIDIEFKDRGVVEYFIDSMLNEDTAYNIKIRVSKDESVRQTAINRLKKILL
ncbi:YkgJ family cysteine cluster protein [Romboutsia lituseburensis]|uniref:Fe-S-cluster containining protein n=1 Tax=Romboutsia lituseburensis DSM 797 TaxID=1121325 RepID=A0A1G9QZS6_9FIRM|nr:YkgJ family cysteine cluster protein [Romboutsia lituseburensis]CEH35807.1 Putative zinc-or iron-chelating domain [Romboutsia lituseburensis]SDM16370.1 Fe-S-cluster containining protein [Romboutsia lituseburensis DSM 797]